MKMDTNKLPKRQLSLNALKPIECANRNELEILLTKSIFK